MKRLIKFSTVLALVLLMLAISSLLTFAEGESVTEPSYTLDDLKFTFNYTSDSVVKEGLTFQTYYDPIANLSGVELVPNFGIGYAIFDDPETEIIDGIRINGAEVTSLRIPINAENPVFKYDIAVRTVYVDTAAGSIAQILDGTYDYTQMLTNPILVIQGIYWTVMVLSGIFGLYVALRNKSKKVKTSDEIANKVFENMDIFKEDLVNFITDVVRQEVLPLAQASVKSGKEAVKAIVLSNSNSKEAPLALLDVFKESEDIDIDTLVESVRESIIQAMHEHDVRRAENTEILQNLAQNTIQEGVTDATESTETKVSRSKSIF